MMLSIASVHHSMPEWPINVCALSKLIHKTEFSGMPH